MKFQFRFESNPGTMGYVGVMADSPIYAGPVASQNAGSSDGGPNGGYYYRVDGGGLNGYFVDALGPTLTREVNLTLQAAYDGRFGKGAWQADARAGRPDRLTSFYIPMPSKLPSDSKVDARAVAMVYSVGPHLQQRIVDRPRFRQVYVDALQGVAEAQRAAGAGAPGIALRLTMLSTNIYSGISPGLPRSVKDPLYLALYRDVAALVLEAVSEAVKGSHPSNLPTTLLVNADQSSGSGKGKEVDAFTHAAVARGITVTPEGFDFDA